jgi:hypothetical protein
VQLDERLEQVLGLALVAARVVLDLLQVRVHREVRETAAVLEERLARVAVGLLPPDRVFDVLAV